MCLINTATPFKHEVLACIASKYKTNRYKYGLNHTFSRVDEPAATVKMNVQKNLHTFNIHCDCEILYKMLTGKQHHLIICVLMPN